MVDIDGAQHIWCQWFSKDRVHLLKDDIDICLFLSGVYQYGRRKECATEATLSTKKAPDAKVSVVDPGSTFGLASIEMYFIPSILTERY